MGKQATGSMVVFTAGVPDKKQYRRFKVRLPGEPNDVAMTRSALDDIPGVGPVARRRLLRHFGSMAKIRAAGVEELRGAGITRPQAEAVKERLGAGSSLD